MHYLTLLLLCFCAACSGFSQVTLDADPPIKILQLGSSRIDKGTPYTFRPDDYVPERRQDLRLSIQSSMTAGEPAPTREYAWRLWYGYGGSLDQVQVPPVGPDGRLWFHRSRDHVLFVQPDSKSVLLVENAWATRMGLDSTGPKETVERAGAAKKMGAPLSPLRYRRVPAGMHELMTAHWTIQVDLPASLVLLYEEGAGQGEFVHLALPKESGWVIRASQLDAGKQSEAGKQSDPGKQSEAGKAIAAITTRFLSMSRILEKDAFSESYFPYHADRPLVLESDLGKGRPLVIRCHPKKPSGSRPPLILCLCAGH